MLKLNGQDFTTGSAQFFDDGLEDREPTSKVYVRVRFPTLEGRTPALAQLDTGAAWSVLQRDVAEELGLFDGSGEIVRMQTAVGSLHGRLERVPLVLVADAGVSLNVQATFFVSPRWHGGTFLGYSGLLDRLRIALDCPRKPLLLRGIGVGESQAEEVSEASRSLEGGGGATKASETVSRR